MKAAVPSLAIDHGRREPLGVSLRDGGINIAVVSRHAARLWFHLFDSSGDSETHRFALPARIGDVHCGFIAGIAAGARYALSASGPFDPNQGHRFDSRKLLVDPYATALDRPFGKGANPKAIVAPPLATVLRPAPRPPGFIYELAVKSFTKLHPKLPELLRGTVAALAHPAIIEHLLSIGADTIELMPIAAWTDERHLPALGLHNAWGYNPVVFMAPDPRLAPGGMAEIATTIAALHQAGLRVILDVVFNHTGESDEWGETLSLRGLDNALYYRHAGGALVNDTGCGNTLAVEHAPVMRLVMDSLRHWVEQAGFDGFRFDLAATLGRNPHSFSTDAPLLAAIAQDPLLRDLILIAEPWDIGPDGYQLGRFPPPWQEWNDHYRDDVRRFWRGDGTRGNLATRLAGSSDVFTRPLASINYLAAHDGFTLRDAVTYTARQNTANGEDNRDGNAHEVSWSQADDSARDNDIKAMLVTLFASRGVPMLTAGDEFGRTQQGNNNAYAQDNAITWLDWSKADERLMAFTTALAKARRHHTLFAVDRLLTGAPTDGAALPDAQWLGEGGAPMTAEAWQQAAGRLLGLVLTTPDDRVCLWINGGDATKAVLLPAAREDRAWVLEVQSSSCHLDGQALSLGARSAVLLGEAPARQPQRHSGVDDSLLSQLADAAGIAPEWWDIDGNRTATSVATQRALLAAMGLGFATPAEARDSLASLAAAETSVHLTRSGGSITLPSSTKRRSATLLLETGEAREIDIGYGGAAALPDMPIGCHRLVDEGRELHLLIAPQAAYLAPDLASGARYYGLAAHLYSLRHNGDAGIGDFETLARFGEAGRELGAALIGINPLHHLFPVDRGRTSPYQPSDRRFLDPIYIAVEGLGGLEQQKLSHADYDGAWALKRNALRVAFAVERSDQRFLEFERQATPALRRHALFECLAELHGHTDWARWSKTEQDVDPADMSLRIWMEWKADTQLAKAAARGHLPLGIYRDLALGCAPDGGERWAEPQRFASGVSIGAPPDPFSRAGQVWNLPPLNPHVLKRLGLAPMAEILSANMRHAGVLRIDHILGFARQFWIPEGAEGKDGAYVAYPLAELIGLTAIESHRARCTVIGEDLGTVPDGLREAMRAANILSYKVLWFEQDRNGFRPLDAYPPLSASCLSSHDLPTFFARVEGNSSEVSALRRALNSAGLTPGASTEDLMIAAHEFLALSPSALMLVQADDLTAEIEPLNVPGTDRERPNWRRRLSQPVDKLAKLSLTKKTIAAVAKHRDRAPHQSSP